MHIFFVVNIINDAYRILIFGVGSDLAREIVKSRTGDFKVLMHEIPTVFPSEVLTKNAS